MSGLLRLGVLADLHLVAGTEKATGWHDSFDFAGVPDRIREALRRFETAGVDAVVVLGDLTHHGDPEAVRALLDVLAGSSLPKLLVTGNHDAGGPATMHQFLAGSAVLADPHGRRFAGVMVAGVHVEAGDPASAELAAPPAVGRWPEEPVVLLSHFPMLPQREPLAAHGLAHAGDLIERAVLATELTGRTGPTVVLSGHLHVRAVATDGPVVQLSCGALIEPPYEWSVVEVGTGQEPWVRRVAVPTTGPSSSGRVSPVLSDPVVTARFRDNRWIVE